MANLNTQLEWFDGSVLTPDMLNTLDIAIYQLSEKLIWSGSFYMAGTYADTSPHSILDFEYYKIVLENGVASQPVEIYGSTYQVYGAHQALSTTLSRALTAANTTRSHTSLMYVDPLTPTRIYMTRNTSISEVGGTSAFTSTSNPIEYRITQIYGVMPKLTQ